MFLTQAPHRAVRQDGRRPLTIFGHLVRREKGLAG